MVNQSLEIPTPPTFDEIRERLRKNIADGEVNFSDPRRLSGLTRAVQSQLEELERRNQYDPREWDLLTRVGVTWIAQGRVLVQTVGAATTTASVAQSADELLQSLGHYGALFTSNQPQSAFWEAGPERWLRIIAPYKIQSAPISTLSISGHSAQLVDIDVGEKWSPVEIDGQVVAFAQGNRLALRFHPFLATNGRLTNASSEERRAALSDVIEASQEHLDIHTDPEENLTEMWNTAHAYATWCLEVSKEASSGVRREISQLVREQTQTQANLEELQNQVQLAKESADAAKENALELPALRLACIKRALSPLEGVAQQVEELSQMNQFSSVRLIQQSETFVIEATTKTLVLDCGRDGLRAVPAFSIHFFPTQAKMPEFPGRDVTTLHPVITRSGEIDWGSVSVPLAMAVGEGNLRNAAATICGFLSRPIARMPRSRNGFRRAEDDSPRGFIDED